MVFDNVNSIGQSRKRRKNQSWVIANHHAEAVDVNSNLTIRCLHCLKTVSYTNYTSSPMISHLLRRHAITVNSPARAEDSPARAEDSPARTENSTHQKPVKLRKHLKPTHGMCHLQKNHKHGTVALTVNLRTLSSECHPSARKATSRSVSYLTYSTTALDKM
jgi:hypothetical protein